MSIDYIRSRYNPEHDTGPDAPVPWSVMRLAETVEKMQERIAELESVTAHLHQRLDAARNDVKFVQGTVEEHQNAIWHHGNVIQKIIDARPLPADAEPKQPAPCPWCGQTPTIVRLDLFTHDEWTVRCTCGACGPTTKATARSVNART